jgi:hypothetical protein
MLSQDEMLNNSPMLRFSKAFAPGTSETGHPFLRDLVIIAAAYDVFLPRKHPSGFPSMSHRCRRAPFSFSLGRSLKYAANGSMNLNTHGGSAIRIASGP